jgi:hypothetical protein
MRMGAMFYNTAIYYPPRFNVNPWDPQDLSRGTEITSVKDPHFRIKPLAFLANGYDRYITVRPERALVLFFVG